MIEDLPDENVVAAGAVTNAATYLKGLKFPARKEDVLRAATRNGADESAMEEIRALPEGREYRSPVDVFDALGDEIRKMRLE